MNYRVTTDKKDMSIDVIHDYLSRSYWAENVPKQIVAKAIDNSLCFTVLCCDQKGNESQIGFARMITDMATFAYLADVYILKGYCQLAEINLHYILIFCLN